MTLSERFWDGVGGAWIVFAAGVHYLPQWGFPVPFAAASAVYAALVVIGVVRVALWWLAGRRSAMS